MIKPVIEKTRTVIEDIWMNHKITNLKSSRDLSKKENQPYSLFENRTKTTIEIRVDWINDYHMAVEIENPAGPEEVANALDYLKNKIIYDFNLRKEENSGKKS